MDVILVLIAMVAAVGFAAVLWRSHRRRSVPAYYEWEYRDKPGPGSASTGVSGLGGPSA